MARLVFFALTLSFAACGPGASFQDLSVNEYDFAQLSSQADGGVQCGQVQCNAEASQVCCIEPTYQFCGSSEACTAGISFYCDGPAECAGGVCCLTAPSTVSCTTNCTGTLVCHVDADCPTATPHCCGAQIGYSGSNHLTCAASCD